MSIDTKQKEINMGGPTAGSGNLLIHKDGFSADCFKSNQPKTAAVDGPERKGTGVLASVSDAVKDGTDSEAPVSTCTVTGTVTDGSSQKEVIFSYDGKDSFTPQGAGEPSKPLPRTHPFNKYLLSALTIRSTFFTFNENQQKEIDEAKNNGLNPVPPKSDEKKIKALNSVPQQMMDFLTGITGDLSAEQIKQMNQLLNNLFNPEITSDADRRLILACLEDLITVNFVTPVDQQKARRLFPQVLLVADFFIDHLRAAASMQQELSPALGNRLLSYLAKDAIDDDPNQKKNEKETLLSEMKVLLQGSKEDVKKFSELIQILDSLGKTSSYITPPNAIALRCSQRLNELRLDLENLKFQQSLSLNFPNNPLIPYFGLGQGKYVYFKIPGDNEKEIKENERKLIESLKRERDGVLKFIEEFQNKDGLVLPHFVSAAHEVRSTIGSVNDLEFSEANAKLLDIKKALEPEAIPASSLAPKTPKKGETPPNKVDYAYPAILAAGGALVSAGVPFATIAAVPAGVDRRVLSVPGGVGIGAGLGAITAAVAMKKSAKGKVNPLIVGLTALGGGAAGGLLALALTPTSTSTPPLKGDPKDGRGPGRDIESAKVGASAKKSVPPVGVTFIIPF